MNKKNDVKPKDTRTQDPATEERAVDTSRRNLLSAGGFAAAAGLAGAFTAPLATARPECQTVVAPVYFPTDSHAGDVVIAGQTVLITGASTGIGLATGEALLAKGAVVIGTSRYPDDYPGHPFPLIELDITDPVSVAGLSGRVLAATGGAGIDALINNAGRFVFGTPVPIPPIDPIFWTEQNILSMATLHFGHIGVTNSMLSLLNPGGAVMFTVSITGYSVGGTDIGEANGQSFLSPYYSGKRALLAYANNLRGFFKTAGLPYRVATVNPFGVNTPLADYGKPIVLEATDASGIPLNPNLDLVLQGTQLFLAGLPLVWIAILAKHGGRHLLSATRNEQPHSERGGRVTG